MVEAGCPQRMCYCFPVAVGIVARSVGCQPGWRALEIHFIDLLFSFQSS